MFLLQRLYPCKKTYVSKAIRKGMLTSVQLVIYAGSDYPFEKVYPFFCWKKKADIRLLSCERQLPERRLWGATYVIFTNHMKFRK